LFGASRGLRASFVIALASVSLACPDKATAPPVAVKVGVTTAPTASPQNRVVFPVQPVVQLQDANGGAVSQAGVVVTVAITAGAGTLSGTATASTNTSGAATFAGLSIAGTTGARTLTFSAPNLSSATANVTLTGGAATAIASNAGNAQTGIAGSPVSVPPSVTVTDVDGNGTSGVAVTFTVASGGGSVSGASATSDANGIATVGSWTLGGTAGSNSLSAVASGLTGSPISFTATGTAGPAAKLSLTTAPSATATNRAVFATQPVVQVRDANNNAVSQSGTLVTASVTSGGGTIGGTATATTNGSGVATFTNLSISGTAGAQTVSFAATGLTAATVTVTTTPGAATTIAKNAGDGQTGSVSTALPVAPSAKVSDIDGNGVAGVSVTFAVASGGGSVTGASATTGTDGVAPVGSWTLGPSNGANTMTATSPGLTGSPLTFTATGAPPVSRIEYGVTTAKINDLAIGGTVTPTSTAYGSSNVVVPNATYTYASRTTAVATVDATGKITAVAAGDAFVVATSTTASSARDSVFVQVRPAAGPVLSTNLTQMAYKAGDIVTVNVKLDMRSATLGAATISLTWPVDAFIGFMTFLDVVDGTSALGVDTQVTSNGMIRANVTVAAGATGVLDLMKVRFTVRSSTAGRYGWIVLLPVDVVDVSSGSLTSSVTALRYPLIVVP